MTDRITEAFDAEIAELQLRLERVVKARAEWVEGAQTAKGRGLAKTTIDRHDEKVRTPIERGRTAYSNRWIVGQVQALLAKKTEPTSLSEIFQYLEVLDIHIGGKTPKNTLSAMLSTSGVLKSHGRAGWTLKKETIAPPSEDSRGVSTGTIIIEPFRDYRARTRQE